MTENFTWDPPVHGNLWCSCNFYSGDIWFDPEISSFSQWMKTHKVSFSPSRGTWSTQAPYTLERVIEELSTQNVISQNYLHLHLEEESHLYWARQEQAKKAQAASLSALTPCISLKNFSLTTVSASFSGFNSQKKNITSSNDIRNNLRLFK